MTTASRKRLPLVPVSGSVVVGAAVLVPLVYVVVEAFTTGAAGLGDTLFRPLTATLLGNTVRLTATVTVLCAVLGTAAAFAVARGGVPAARWWSLLLIAPLAIPEYVTSSTWIALFPSLHGFRGAVLVMSLSRFPLVYLPVLATLRTLDPALEDVGASLGLSRWQVFRRVTLPQLRVAVAGGSALVALYMLAEYGAFALMRFQVLTTAIYLQYKVAFDVPRAAALAMVLVALSLVVLVLEWLAAGRRRYAVAARPARSLARRPGGWVWLLPLGALAAVGVGVPIGSLVRSLLYGQSSTLPSTSIVAATLHTLGYGAAAALLATVAAVPISVLSVRHRTAAAAALERIVFVPRAIPGIVVGLAMVGVSVKYVTPLYQSATLLVVAYAILFLPLAVVAVRSALLQASPVYEQVAATMGASPIKVAARVTTPLVRTGLAASFALVFLSCQTELTATLLLRPTGVQTLATRFWAYSTSLAYGAAAPYAVLMVLLSAIPVVVLNRSLTRR